MKTQVLQFTEAFPPAHKVIEIALNIDYKKHYNTFMNAVQIMVAFMAIIVAKVLEMWSEYDMTERTQIAVLNAHNWTKETAVPSIEKFIENTYQSGVKVREVYEKLNSPLFITL